MKIKDLLDNGLMEGIRFKHPKTGETCLWYSQWGYADGKAGVWYRTDPDSSRIFPLCLDSLSEALEFEVVQEDSKNAV